MSITFEINKKKSYTEIKRLPLTRTDELDKQLATILDEVNALIRLSSANNDQKVLMQNEYLSSLERRFQTLFQYEIVLMSKSFFPSLKEHLDAQNRLSSEFYVAIQNVRRGRQQELEEFSRKLCGYVNVSTKKIVKYIQQMNDADKGRGIALLHSCQKGGYTNIPRFSRYIH
jgi:hypothetical protein